MKHRCKHAECGFAILFQWKIPIVIFDWLIDLSLQVFCKRKNGCSKKRTIGAENRVGLGTPMLCPSTARMLALMRKSNYWANFGHPDFFVDVFSLVKMQHEPQNKQPNSNEKTKRNKLSVTWSWIAMIWSWVCGLRPSGLVSQRAF